MERYSEVIKIERNLEVVLPIEKPEWWSTGVLWEEQSCGLQVFLMLASLQAGKPKNMLRKNQRYIVEGVQERLPQQY